MLTPLVLFLSLGSTLASDIHHSYYHDGYHSPSNDYIGSHAFHAAPVEPQPAPEDDDNDDEEGEIKVDPTFYRRLERIRSKFGNKPLAQTWAKYWVRNRAQRERRQINGNYYYSNPNNINPSNFNNPSSIKYNTIPTNPYNNVNNYNLNANNNPYYNPYSRYSQQDQRIRFRQNRPQRTTTTTTKRPRKKPFRPAMVFFKK